MNDHKINLRKPWRQVEKYLLFEPMPMIIAFLGITIFRPIPFIWSTAFGLVGLLSFGWTAQEVGFSLSGSELGILMIGGWAFGLMFESVLKLIRRN